MISPIRFEVRGWPLGAGDGRVEAFRRHVVTQMAAGLVNVTGDRDYTVTPGAIIFYYVYEPGWVTPKKEAQAPVSLLPSENFVDIPCSGQILLPSVMIIQPNMTFELAAIKVKGKRSSSEADRE